MLGLEFLNRSDGNGEHLGVVDRESGLGFIANHQRRQRLADFLSDEPEVGLAKLLPPEVHGTEFHRRGQLALGRRDIRLEASVADSAPVIAVAEAGEVAAAGDVVRVQKAIVAHADGAGVAELLVMRVIQFLAAAMFAKETWKGRTTPLGPYESVGVTEPRLSSHEGFTSGDRQRPSPAAARRSAPLARPTGSRKGRIDRRCSPERTAADQRRPRQNSTM